jgi:DNA-binding MarR family transcriptional regulator
METVADSLVLAAVRRGNRHQGQIAGAARLPGRELFAALRRLERDGLVVRRRRLIRLTRVGEEALRLRRLELR